MDMGLSHRGAVLSLYGVGGLFAATAFALVVIKSIWIASLLVGVLGAMLATFIILLYLRIRRAQSTPVQPKDARPVDVDQGPNTTRTLPAQTGARQ